MMASVWGRVGIDTKEKESHFERLGCWISLCYGPFSFGLRFETKRSLFFNFSKFFGVR
jgi:hypothetical protein